MAAAQVSQAVKLSQYYPYMRRAWVERCFSQMQGLPESNKADATNEMKKVIAEAQLSGTMWTTDWAGVQLQRCVLVPFAQALSH